MGGSIPHEKIVIKFTKKRQMNKQMTNQTFAIREILIKVKHLNMFALYLH